MQSISHTVHKILTEKTCWLLVAAGLVHGLIYVWLIPPWQHYDEPGHFEYAWLIAHRQKLPSINDYDQDMRLAVGQSLIETRFFDRGGLSHPNLTDPSQPIWMGVSQVEDPPFYYILTALPLYLFQNAPVAWQLYAGRVFTLVFFLMTVYAAYHLIYELSPQSHSLRWLIPLTIVLMPGIVEFMSALNDYPAAIGLFSMWMLVVTRLIKKKWSLGRLIWLLVLSLACLLTQKVVYWIVPILPLVIILAVLPRAKEWMGWVGYLSLVMIIFIVAFEWNDAAFWLRRNEQNFASRVTLPQESTFDNALAGKLYPDQYWAVPSASSKQGFFQLVPMETSSELKGKWITLGAWVWADEPISGYSPGINALTQFEDHWFGFEPTEITTSPRFIATTLQVPWEHDRLQIWLRTTSPTITNANIYFTGVVMAEGRFPTEAAPKLNEDGSIGQWGGVRFQNRVRNGLFSQTWPFLRPSVTNIVEKAADSVNPTTISSFIALFLDYPGTSWYISSTTDRIFRTFWATFGWGHVSLAEVDWLPRPYLILLVVTALGVAASLVPLGKLFAENKSAVAMVLIAAVITTLVAYLYGVYTMGGALRFRAYIPVARYIFPAIIPIVMILSLGWYDALAFLQQLFHLPKRIPEITVLVFLALLNLYAVFSVLQYYRT